MMKTLIAFHVSAIILLLPFLAATQNCNLSDSNLGSQAEVNAFPSGCTIVNSDLTINGDDITDLRKFTKE